MIRRSLADARILYASPRPRSEQAYHDLQSQHLAHALGLWPNKSLLNLPSVLDEDDLCSRLNGLEMRPRTPRKNSRRASVESTGTASPKSPPKVAVIRELAEHPYLVAIGLVNNFYYNLVTWTSKTRVGIGVQAEAYWWNQGSKVYSVSESYPSGSMVCCLECGTGPARNHTAIAWADGHFMVLKKGKYRKLTYKFISPIHCVRWIDAHTLTGGDLTGHVYILSCRKVIEIEVVLTAATQQISGT